MNQNTALISICIPTYNRASYLEINLKQLFINWQELTDKSDVEIIISNNASTDGTDAIVQQFVDLGLPIRYFSNEKNLGADGNFYNSYQNATGKYVWIFGDDELLFNHSLVKIIAILKKHEIGCLYLEGISYEQSFDLNQYADIPTENIKLLTGDEYIKQVHFYLTFCTGNIFNKSIIPRHFDCKPYIGTNLIQVSWYLMAIKHADQNIVLKQKYFFAKNANTGGYKLFKTFSTNFNVILRQYTSTQNIRWINNQLIRSFFPIFINNANKFSTENGFWELFKNYYDYPLFWKKLVFKQIIKSIKKKLK